MTQLPFPFQGKHLRVEFIYTFLFIILTNGYECSYLNKLVSY